MDTQALLEAMDGVALLIDGDLIVRHVGWRNWNSFWSANGGSPHPVNVVGRELTGFFTPGKVRDTYRVLFLEVMERRRQSVKIQYRCDSPVLRRSMRLAVTSVDEASKYLLYQSTLIAVEQRPPIPLFDAPAAGSDEPGILKICSICAKVEWSRVVGSSIEEWVEPQDYYRRGGSDVVAMSHGFCPACYDVLMNE